MVKAAHWSVPLMWPGETVVILASGPSMSAAVADQICDSKFRTIAVNNTFKLAPWADMLYAADAVWWKTYYAETSGMRLKVTCSEVPFADVMRLRDSGRDGFDDDRGAVRTGGNSGYQAIHVAAHAGAKRILLCGFDMRGGHWHGRHLAPLREHGEGIYARWIARFKTLAAALSVRGVEVLNCTPDSALKVWPIVPLAEQLRARELAA